jgi:hypothetical protein
MPPPGTTQWRLSSTTIIGSVVHKGGQRCALRYRSAENFFMRSNWALPTAALADGQVAHESDGEERQDRDYDASSGHPLS